MDFEGRAGPVAWRLTRGGRAARRGTAGGGGGGAGGQSLKKYDKAFKDAGTPQLKGGYFDGLKAPILLLL